MGGNTSLNLISRDKASHIDLGVINKDLIMEAGHEVGPGEWRYFEGGWKHGSHMSIVGRRARESAGKAGAEEAKGGKSLQTPDWQPR